ncbi:hypothetical protein BDP27DRAFT_1447042 [Rhodocollybia butyracea]|uniref:Uncharacterized protein n=1 Tax=Rhodocollybia butyracea TaxID=206335 RepID=A0A9P5PWE5_9AGAR|nr:hypothetical protein BDP27DRAFT_1447042 [Rhodocollybia butyracea]
MPPIRNRFTRHPAVDDLEPVVAPLNLLNTNVNVADPKREIFIIVVALVLLAYLRMSNYYAISQLITLIEKNATK